MKILKFYLSIIFYLCVFSVNANTHVSVRKKTEKIILATEHTLIAPEGTRYQWYLNNIQIEGADEQELSVTSSGFYKVELTTFNGDVIEKNTIVGLTAAGAIIRIFTIGDSTVQDYTAGYYPRKGWGQVLPIFFNTANVSVINKAVGGTSSKSFYNLFWPAVRNGLQAGDFVFIQFGINDRNSADPDRYTPTGGEFESYLTKYINETKAKGAFPVLVATLRRNSWNANGTVYDAYHDHPVATRTLAKQLGVPLIDLDAKAKVLLESVGQTYSTRFLYNNYVAGEYPNYKNGNTDDVHFQEMGAIEMAKLVCQGIRDLSADPNVSKLIPFLKPEYQIAVAVNPVGADQVTTHTTTYPQGLTITLKTIPKTTSTFQKWNNAAGTQLSTATLTTVISGTAATSYTAMYLGATTNPCTASITSPSNAICSGTSVVLTANAGASYKWFNGTTQVGTVVTYTAIAAGNYTVEVTNASGCKATSAIKTITVNALPTITPYAKVDAGAWTSVSAASTCEGSTLNLGPQPNLPAGWSWTGPNNFSSALRDPILTNLLVANAGNYIATYTDANGCKATNTFTLQVSKPTATITSPATSLCTGGSVVLTANAGSSYKWFNGTTQVGTAVTYTANTPGAYTVEVTNAAGCKATSAVTQITASAAPTATITSPAASFCAGSSVVLTSSAGASYKWFNGATQVGTAATYTAIAAGNYTVEVTNAAGCKTTSAVTQITMNAAPTATITSPAASFCAGSSVVLTSSAGASYKWFNGATQVATAATYTAIAAGNYTVEVTNASGCKATSAIKTITVNALPTITPYAKVDAGAWTSVSAASTCEGSTLNLGPQPNLPAGWSWTGPNNFTSVLRDPILTNLVVANAGNYIATYTDPNGCKATSTFALQVSKPTATITSPATSFCTGSSVLLTASAGNSYKWFNGTTQVGTAVTYTANTAGAYTVEVTNAAGCKATSAVTTITVNTLPTATITSPATSFCTGSSVLLTASAGNSYKWFNGTTQVGTAVTYTANTAGAYTVEVTNAAGCKATSAATTITVNTLPTATITSPATSFCTGSSVLLTASAGNSYKWFNGTTQVGTSSAYTATSSGAYTVEVTNSSNCKSTSAATNITENTSAIATPTITTSSTTFCPGGSTILSASAGNSYKWFNGTAQVGTSSAYTAITVGTYTVEVTNAGGCKATSAAIQISIGSALTWYADTDNDGVGDIATAMSSCTKPNGYVATAGDACPNDANKTASGNCGCGNSETSCVDCNGTPNGTAFLDNCSTCVGGTTDNTACVTTATKNNSSTKNILSIYPQPFTDLITISLENKNIKTVTFFNLQGLIIEFRQNINSSEIQMGESLAAGVYFIMIESETEAYTSKVIKY